MMVHSLFSAPILQEKLEYDTSFVPSQTIREYIKQNIISVNNTEDEISELQIQPASIDLRLGPIAYELKSSFLPGGKFTIIEKLKHTQLHTKKLDLNNPTVLQPGNVYLVELIENLTLPPTIWAKANPRSTAGRANLFTRLICDYTTEFEGVPPGYTGKLYAEIVPKTFPVMIQKGTRVNQLRFCQINSTYKAEDINKEFISAPRYSRKELLSVSLIPENSSDIIGYRAIKTHNRILNFDCIACHDVSDFWEPIRYSDLQSIILNPEDFYIFRSYEKKSVKPEFAAELAPYDSSLGEFRVHYAGFLDPGFGWPEETTATPIVLEIRVRDVPFLIEHGQTLAIIYYYQLASLPDKIYGSNIGSSYQLQGISLGKQFKPLTQPQDE